MKKLRGRPPHKDILTLAEWRTANAVRHGLTNQQIADLEKISLDGVKYHVANTIAKLGLKNRKALKCWVGIPEDSLLIIKGENMNNQHSILALGQTARTVKNIEKSEAWYRDVLGLAHLYTFGTLAFFDLGGVRLMLSESEDVNAAESILYFRVSDIHFSYETLTTLGVKFVNAPHMIHKHEDGSEEWMVFFEDLEGRNLALMSVVESS